MVDFKFEENNKDKIKSESDRALERALEIIGIKAEKYAKARCPVGTQESTGIKGYRGGTLRNSYTHSVEMGDGEGEVTVGSNVEYAPYVELGTGGYFDTPPEWEQFDAPKGSGTGSGYVRPRPHLRPAIEDHIPEYEKVFKSEMGG